MDVQQSTDMFAGFSSEPCKASTMTLISDKRKFQREESVRKTSLIICLAGVSR